jgi:CHASE3 domain sensor protein
VLCLLLVERLLVEEWRTIDEDLQRQAWLKEEVRLLERLVVEVDSSFRGYLLAKQSVFLQAMKTADGSIPGVIERVSHLSQGWPDLQGRIEILRARVMDLLDTKRRLAMQAEQGGDEVVLAYIRGGDGLAMAKTLALAFEDLNHKIDMRRGNRQTADRLEWIRWGLTTTGAVGFLWGIGIGKTTVRVGGSAGRSSVSAFGPASILPRPSRAERDPSEVA